MMGKLLGAALVLAAALWFVLARLRARRRQTALLRELVKEGMVDGIEIDHPSNSPEDRAECIAQSEQKGLNRTGGTQQMANGRFGRRH